MDGEMVFVVDDNADGREAASMLLTVYGWRTRTFDDASSCVAAAADDPPACILSDLQMPRMDGNALMEALRATGVNVPVVVMTGASKGSDAAVRASSWPTRY